MKIIIPILFFVLSVSGAFGSTIDTKTFVYDGTQDSVQFLLRAEETHIEYRLEHRQTTCYRTDTYYRTECRQTPQGRYCDRVPTYRRVAYPCTQTVRIPYEVKDFDVEANVNLAIENLPITNAREAFKLVLDGDQLSISASGTKKFFIVLKKQDVATTIQGRVKFIEANYLAELVEASPILMALNLNTLTYDNKLLTFKTGPISNMKDLGFSLEVQKAPVLGSDTTIFNRELVSGDLEINVQSSFSSVLVDFNKLGIDFSDGRYTITAKIFYKYIGTILNESQFDSTHSSKTLVYKIR